MSRLDQAPPAGRVPELVAGDRLTREEFERRYAAMPDLKKAELIEGVVYVPSPVRAPQHGMPQFLLATWLGVYSAHPPAVSGSDNTTVRLDLDNEPQPDLFLRTDPAAGGQSTIGPDGYVEGAPELVAEVTASTASYDLHDKKRAYRRNGVREYLVWRTVDAAVDWFVLRGGRYMRLRPDDEGVLRSEVYPGLWLDAPALLRGDLRRVLAVLDQGLASPEHTVFAEGLRRRLEG